jgi:anti-anti-sigma factor
MEGFTTQQIGQHTIIEFQSASLMDPQKLDEMSARLYRLIDLEDHRMIVLDFRKVEYISSQFIGILMMMQKKLAKLPKSKLVLCSVGSRLSGLLRITKLDKILPVHSTHKEAIKEH